MLASSHTHLHTHAHTHTKEKQNKTKQKCPVQYRKVPQLLQSFAVCLRIIITSLLDPTPLSPSPPAALETPDWRGLEAAGEETDAGVEVERSEVGGGDGMRG